MAYKNFVHIINNSLALDPPIVSTKGVFAVHAAVPIHSTISRAKMHGVDTGSIAHEGVNYHSSVINCYTIFINFLALEARPTPVATLHLPFAPARCWRVSVSTNTQILSMHGRLIARARTSAITRSISD
eukprot:COSAG01_NODE_1648_length_9629_cov_9.733998_10_plen_129_part_00